MSNVGEKNGEFAPLDLYRPKFEDKGIVLCMRGKKPGAWRAHLKIIVPGSVYLVCHAEYGLKVGQILVRNLDLGLRLGFDEKHPQYQTFVRYDNLFDAWRAMSRLNPRYTTEEIPTMKALREEGDSLVEICWTLTVQNVAGRLEYQTRAWRVVNTHKHVVNKNKDRAVRQMERATSITDRNGRENPGRLPLMLLTVDLALWARILEARNIGHYMDRRALMLQSHIEAYDSLIQSVRLDLEHELRKDGVFSEEKRTARQVRDAAKRVRMGVNALAKVKKARPYIHVLDHVAQDLSQAAVFMDEAAVSHDPLKRKTAKSLLNRSYRSLYLLQKGRLIHEVLATVAASRYRKVVPSFDTVSDLIASIKEIQNTLESVEPFTEEPIEKEFVRPVLPDVLANLEIVGECLELLEDDSVKLLKKAHKHLKLAVKPL